MKRILKSFLIIGISLISYSIHAQGISLPPSGENQKASVSQHMGLAKVSIYYSSPDVDNREGKIWGGLVPWGMVNLGFGSAKESPWRAGANENTIIAFSENVKVEGKDLAAGKYGFHIITRETGKWTLIFSKNYSSWGSYYYNPEEDALRVDVTPEACEFEEWLTYGFENRQLESTGAFLKWENMKVPFKIEVPDILDLHVNKIRDELRSSPGFSYLNWMQAAAFCAQNKINLNEALTWAETAISTPFIGQKNFQTLQTKAAVLTAMDKNSEADEVMNEAISDPAATVTDLHQYGRSLLAKGENEKAMNVFLKNRKIHPDDTFTTYVGLARGYEANGDTKKAIKNWEVAIKNIPENQKPNIAYYESELKRLKDK